MNGHGTPAFQAAPLVAPSRLTPSPASPGAEPNPTLGALSRELVAAREMALGLQDAVAELLASEGDGFSAAVFRLQSLDRLTQTLEDLAGYVAALAQGAGPGWRPDLTEALATLRLRDLAERLSGCEPVPAPVPTSPPGPSPTPAGGDDYLF